MSIVDLIDDGVEIPVGKGFVKARGLTVEDIGTLAKENLAQLAPMFEGKIDFQKLITEFPEFVAKVIAAGIGEPENSKVVKKLPAGVQYRLLQSIWEQTGVTAEDVGKLMRGLVDGLSLVNQNLALLEPGKGS